MKIALLALALIVSPLLAEDMSEGGACLMNGVNCGTGTPTAATRIQTSGTLPGSCTAGDVYVNAAAESGQQLHVCEEGAWVAVKLPDLAEAAGAITATRRFDVDVSGSGGEGFHITTPYGMAWGLTSIGHWYNGTDNTFDLGILGNAPRTVRAVTSFILTTPRSPAATDPCEVGEQAWSTTHEYRCTATDTWKRVALTGGY